MCQFTSMAEVAKAVFGGGSSNDGVPREGEYNDLAKGATFEQAIANINSALRV